MSWKRLRVGGQLGSCCRRVRANSSRGDAGERQQSPMRGDVTGREMTLPGGGRGRRSRSTARVRQRGGWRALRELGVGRGARKEPSRGGQPAPGDVSWKPAGSPKLPSGETGECWGKEGIPSDPATKTLVALLRTEGCRFGNTRKMANGWQ